MSLGRRAVYKGNLTYGLLNIPVAIYKTRDCYQLPGTIHHVDCDGSVHQRYVCEEHPDDEEIALFSGVDIAGTVVPINTEARDLLLDRKAPLEVVASHKLTNLTQYIIDGSLVPMEVYELTGQQNQPTNLDGSHDALATLLYRLSVKKKFLEVQVGLGGVVRHAILLHTRQLWTMTYAEEMRLSIGLTGTSNKELGKHMDELIEQTSSETMYMPSLAEIDTKVTAWFTRMARNLKRYRKVMADA